MTPPDRHAAHVTVSGSAGVQVGDHNHQRNLLTGPAQIRPTQVGNHSRMLFFVQLPRSVRIAVVTVIVVALLGVGTWTYLYWWRPNQAPTYQTEFLIDTAGSSDSADLTGLTDALTTTVGNSGDSDALAIRGFGGECGADDNTTQLVDFDTGNRTELTRAASRVRPGGQATLVRGIIEAVEDFSGPFAQRARYVNRVIVVTRHGADGCDADSSFVEQEIRNRLDAAGLSIEFRLIGYQISDAERDQLNRIAVASRAPQPMFVTTPADLALALNWYTNIEPVLTDATRIVELLNPTITQVNDAVAAITTGRLDAAGQLLRDARSAITATGSRFAELRSRRNSPAAHDIHQRALRLRGHQAEVIDTAEELLRTARAGGSTGPGLATFGQLAAEYNTEVTALNEALATLRASAPAGPR